MSVHIGERLKEERRRVGLTQAELAAAGNVIIRTQINYEQGKRVPDAEYLAGIMGAGIDVLYVISGQRTPKGDAPLTDDAARLVKNYNQVDSTGKTAAQQLLSTLAAGKKRAA